MLPTNTELGGRYRIVEFLSQGGFGAVYKALDPVLNRPVAIKMLTLSQAEVDPERQRVMLRSEAQTIARLDHPHILKIHDLYVPDEGSAYIVMALAEGKSLDLLIGKPLLTEAYAEQLFVQLCRAVDFAHDKGVLHLDIKPKNVLLDGAGNALLADFGIARVLQDVSRITVHSPLGTPVYMPPEQRHSGKVGRYSDVYTLGVTLHELLTGARPIRPANDKDAVLELSAALPASVRAVIACATEADPARRYRSAGELAAALIDALHPEQALAADHARTTARSRQQQDLARLEQRLAELQSRVPPAPTELPGAAPAPVQSEGSSALDALAIAETQAAIVALRTRLLAETSTEPANPYRGLDPFEAADADRFFGREELVEELAERLGGCRLVAVLGPSGSGKSSLVLAGLLPQLQRGTLPGAGNWLVRTLRPGGAPLCVLATTVALLTGRRGDEALALEDAMRRDERVLEAELRLLLAAAPPQQRLLFVVDQLEELFTQCADEEARQMFLANLLYASQDAAGPTAFVLTMRADYYGAAAAYPAFAAHLRANHLLVGPMSPIELRRAIEEPARLAGVVYAPGVVDVIIDDITGRPGALPLLQQALTETWLIRRGRVIALADYRASNGVAGALAGRAQHEYEQLSVEQQSAADRLLLRLVQPGDGGDDMRRRATLAEVVSGVDSELVRAIIERFTARHARLLTTAESPGVGATIELTHEALITAWPRLRELLRDHRDGLRTHRRLTEAAGEWERSGHDVAYLSSGAQLFTAQEWAGANPASPNEREQAFLAASLDAATAARQAEEAARERERRDARRLRVLAIVLAGAALVLAGLFYVANTLRLSAETAQARESEARLRAESQALAVQSQAEVSRDPDLALLLAIEAAKRDQGPFVEEALHQAIARAPLSIQGHYGPVYDLARSPDGRRLAVAGDLSIEVWDLVTGRRAIVLTNPALSSQMYLATAFSPDGTWLLAASQMGNLCIWRVADWTLLRCIAAHEGRIAGLSVAPDSARVVTAGADQQAAVWDLATGERLLTLSGHSAAIHRATFSPDGRTIATGSWDKTVKLWDATSGAELRTLAGHADIVRSVAFSPDGARLLSGGHDQTARVWDTATGQLLATLTGHSARVTRALFSADGQQVITASADATVKVWDAASGAELRTLTGHEASVTSLVLADGVLLYSSGVDGQVRTWDLSTGSGTVALKVHSAQLHSVAYSRDGSMLASAGGDWAARVWDTTSGALRLTVRGHETRIVSAEFNAEGNRLLTAGADGTARLWEIATGRELARYTLPDPGGVRHAIFSPDGRTVAASIGPSVQLLDAETLQPVRTLSGTITNTWKLAFSPDGALLAVLPADREITRIDILDVATGQPTTGYGFFDNPTQAFALAFSPDGSRLATVSQRGDAIIWDLEKRQRLRSLTSGDLSSRSSTEISGGVEGLMTVDFSPDGKYLLTGGLDMAIRVWDTQSWTLQQTLRGHTHAVAVATFSPGGTTIASGDFDGVVKLWQLESRPELPGFGTTENGTYKLAQHPDGKHLFVVGDDGAQLWDAQTGAVVMKIPGSYTAGAISPDGALVAVVGLADGLKAPVAVWDIQTQKQVAWRELELGAAAWGLQFSPDSARVGVTGTGGTTWVLAVRDLATITELADTSTTSQSLAFSNDGRRILLSSGDGTADVYAVEDGTLLQTFRWRIDLRDAAYSPDERLVALAAHDGSIVVYDTQTSTVLRELTGHRSQVSSNAFSPDSKLIVSTSFDGTARLWDAATGELRTTLWTHNQPLVNAVFSPDGSRVAVLSLDGRVRQYLVQVDDLRALAEQLVSRELTPEELGRYLGQAPPAPTATP